ncbi:hypothetical protein SCP_0104920 [Sparassis crispa]|uniref:Uncharacterized protein n=1 Tax=Sparassis crispa TaxID=139825 RepID=A0A401G619_9APHY|nr:hypothetical protein SCP_0104920 [Sparassis crispa]GBE77612.1 hypothetical protein SCP_0104920 [Sparassis crispa]
MAVQAVLGPGELVIARHELIKLSRNVEKPNGGSGRRNRFLWAILDDGRIADAARGRR